MKKLFFLGALLASSMAVYALDTVRESTYQNACDNEDSLACLELGIMYHLGDGVNQNFSRAKEFYLKACKLGSGSGCSHVGFMYENGHAGRNDAKAVSYYKQACDLGDAGGCASLGTCYENGTGVKENMEMALTYHDKACDGGMGSSCAHLGLLYENDENYIDAAVYHQKGCDAGEATECSRLGVMYYNAQGVNPNQRKAADLFKKACELGDESGCKNYEIVKNNNRWFD